MAVALEVAKVRRGDMPRGEEEHRPGDEGLAAKRRKGIMGSEGAGLGCEEGLDSEGRGSVECRLTGCLLCFQ